MKRKIKLTATKVYGRFMGFIAGVQDKVVQDSIENLQKSLEYCMEENRVLKELLEEATGRKRLILKDSHRRRLAAKGIALSKHILENIMTMFQPETLLRWHRDLIKKKYSKRSTPEHYRKITPEMVREVLRLAKRNSNWGYQRIRDMMRYLGFEISTATVRRILDEHGIKPDPKHKPNITWNEFIKSHWEVLAATDFLSVELLTPFGLMRCMILFFIDIQTRTVKLGGVKINPDGAWVKQIARNMTDSWDGFLLGKKYLICDRDPLFTKDVEQILKGRGVKIKRIAAGAPSMNCYSEAFVKTLKFECLNKMIFLSERQVRYAVTEFIQHYNEERTHTGLDGQIPFDIHEQPPDGKIIEFSRLGGMLKTYRRVYNEAA
ncbi:MAG: integrase core domain-containing protein [Victivallales bacterium]|nr:integrase core domain-containing protein [Victivallales bacterium]